MNGGSPHTVGNGLPKEFQLERFMARYEFQTNHPMCLSDCEPLSLQQVLALADEECKQMWSGLSLGYTESDGHPVLRREIANLYESVTPEDVIVMVPQEAIQIAARALLKSGDHVICVHPAYQSLYEIAQNIGCAVDFWQLRSDDGTGRLHFYIEDLKRLMKPETRAVFTNFPHNPSGAMLSCGDWQQVIDCCRSVGAVLFSDEMYRMLERDPASRLPSAVDCYERGVTLSGMSKSLGMAGIRLGWLVSKDPGVRSKLQLLHDYHSICNAAPSEILAIIGLRARRTIVSDNLALIAANVALAEDFFGRHSGTFQFTAPDGGSIAFPRLITGEPVESFCDRLVRDQGVFLLPATVYSDTASVQQGRFRLGLGRRGFAAGLAALEKFIMRTDTVDISGTD